MKKLKIAYYIIVGLLCLIAVFLIISILPITGNFKILTVLSGSMEPSIHTGSVVIVKSAPSASSGQATYKIGDVITFGLGTKTPTTHRIQDIKVQAGQETYITKGDANKTPDAKEITRKDIIGKVRFSIPLLGYVVSFVRKPLGFMILIIVPAIAIIMDEVKKIYTELKTKKQGQHKNAELKIETQNNDEKPNN